LAFQDFRFISRQFKHEVRRKAIGVAFDGAIQRARGDAVKRSQITVQHHALAANQENRLFDLFRSNQRRLGVHAAGEAYWFGPINQGSAAFKIPIWNLKAASRF
jgi:hypothetical protein